MNPIQNALLESQNRRPCAPSITTRLFLAYSAWAARPTPGRCISTRSAKRFRQRPASIGTSTSRFSSAKAGAKSFYFRGTSGLLAKLITRQRPRRPPAMRDPIEELLDARSIEEQEREIYRSKIRHRIWTPCAGSGSCRAASRSSLLLGVPWPQRGDHHAVPRRRRRSSSRDALEAVVMELPFHDNYFMARLLPGPLHAGMLSGISAGRKLRAIAARWCIGSRFIPPP